MASPRHPPYIPGLNKLIQDIWGRPQALLRNKDGIEFLDLEEYIPALRHFSKRSLKTDKILVRQEYRDAFDAIYTDVYYQNGSFVIGQPGIGKTYFLFYALICLLGLKKTVAMQPLDGSQIYIFFTESGCQVYYLDNHQPLHDHGPGIWALCDANRIIISPPTLFEASSNVRVLLTTSPSAIHWRAFSKETDAAPFIMDIWSNKEVEGLAALLQLDVQHTIDLANKWGGTPGTWIKCTTPETKGQVEGTFYERVGAAVRNCGAVIEGAGSLDFPPGAPSQFFFIRPRRDPDTRAFIRYRCYVEIPTRTVCEYLAEGLMEQNNRILSDFYTALFGPSGTRRDAGIVYETLFHNRFALSKDLRLYWLDGTRVLSTALQLPSLPMVVPSTLDAVATHTPPFYWRPSSTKFPGIDSVLMLENQVFAFQSTLCKRHGPPDDGLKALQKTLPRSAKDLPLRLFFVGTTEKQIRKVAEMYTGLSIGDKQIPVGWVNMVPSTASDLPDFDRGEGQSIEVDLGV